MVAQQIQNAIDPGGDAGDSRCSWSSVTSAGGWGVAVAAMVGLFRHGYSWQEPLDLLRDAIFMMVSCALDGTTYVQLSALECTGTGSG